MYAHTFQLTGTTFLCHRTDSTARRCSAAFLLSSPPSGSTASSVFIWAALTHQFSLTLGQSRQDVAASRSCKARRHECDHGQGQHSQRELAVCRWTHENPAGFGLFKYVSQTQGTDTQVYSKHLQKPATLGVCVSLCVCVVNFIRRSVDQWS